MKAPPSLRALAASLVLVLVNLGAAHAASADRLAQVHRIGIISALGDRVEILVVGFTVLDGKNGYLPIDTWRLNDLAIRDAAAMLGSRFQISPVDYDAASVLPADTDTRRSDLPLKPFIQALPTSDVDAYLVIRRTICCAINNWTADGLGAQKNKTLFHVLHPFIFVTLEVDLVQAGTGKTLISRTLAPSTANLEESNWADTPAGMSPEQVENLHAQIVDLVHKDIARTLAAMGLASP